ncbi:hypothetical protein [Cellulomonas cellasea]|uniref:Uncharacterized protein n=1 Tax=Cellulomonas cellasea TaxID=43670 RepID=A0A7W4YAV8_9CELL|nr:hypothetical protein [Cellulomonas cellasea]MBB2923200.1 hypothetical protein [Cellulomonas cellasea]
MTVSGTFTVTGLYNFGGSDSTIEIAADGSSCSGRGGFGDIAAGTSVTVYDAAGTIVGTTPLGQGNGERMWSDDVEHDPDLYYGPCTLPFSVQVPDSPFYQVEVSYRGKSTVQRADAASVALTLGS